jgi:hypothetical protein
VQFNMPELRVGTLDALLALSDDMVKTVTHVEAVVGKIRRQLAELDRNAAEVRARATRFAPPTRQSGRAAGLYRAPPAAGTSASRRARCGCAQRAGTARSATRRTAASSLRSPSAAQARPARAQLSELAVDGVPLRRYLTAFQWNEAKCVPPAKRSACARTVLTRQILRPAGTRRAGRCVRRWRSWALTWRRLRMS